MSSGLTAGAGVKGGLNRAEPTARTEASALVNLCCRFKKILKNRNHEPFTTHVKTVLTARYKT